jgi:purine-nucleoside phosphorylase
MTPVPTTSPGAPGAHPFEQARIAARELGRMTGADHHDVLVVLGTRLFSAAEPLGATGPSIDLTSLPWFARFTGPGHRPEAWSVQLEGKRALVVAGRLHLYEGRSPAEVVHLVRTAIAAGVKTAVLTCAAGAVRSGYSLGELVAISDHLNLTGTSPLVGAVNGASHGARHAGMTDAWSPRLRALAHAVEPIEEGVYAQTLGPQLETAAEIRMLAALGADLVGTSNVLEAIAARQLGTEVLGLAVVTNVAGGTPAAADAGDADAVERIVSESAPTVAKIVTGVLRALDKEIPAPLGEENADESTGD